MPETKTQQRGKIRTLTGTVVTAKADKTITVAVTRPVKHALYGKYIRRTTKVHVHDPRNSSQLGDTVQIAQCKPMSKTKSWRLLKLINRPESAE